MSPIAVVLIGRFDEEVGCAGRATFIVDKAGILRWKVENAIPDARSLDEYTRVLDGLP